MNIFIEYIPSALIFIQLAIWLELFKFAEVAQLVEHSPSKPGVAGSRPVFRSKLKNHTAIIKMY